MSSPLRFISASYASRSHRPAGRSSVLGLGLVLAVAVFGLLASVPGPASGSAGHRITSPIPADSLDEVYWRDTWGAPRSGGRSHIGVDMMGPKGVPLLAVNDSEVTWGRFDNDRGTIVRIRDTAGWEYQYIHINNDTPGTDDGNATCLQALAPKLCDTLDGTRLQRGITFQAGELIGYLGDSGNAEWTGAHLHFEVYQPDGNGGVSPVNPTPYVDSARIVALDQSGPVGPFSGTQDAAASLTRRLEGREPGSSERLDLADAIGRDGLAQALAERVEGDPAVSQIDRLYLAFFQRPADGDIDYWLGVRGDGHRLEDIAEWFAESDEYTARYAGLDFADFLDRLYLDVLGRAPDVEGRDYWMGKLADGEVTRGTIVVYFVIDAEMRNLARGRSEAVAVHRALGLEVPTAAEIDAWNTIRATTPLHEAIDGLLQPSS